MQARELLRVIEHRPYPLPRGPWIMRQTWHDLLFAHWAMDPELVRAAMPEPVRPYLDLYDGQAWVGVIPFWMSGVRPRGTPPVPTASTFPELNVRTYVTINGKPGVYFFSLDAASLLAVVGARVGFALRYFWARMHCELANGQVQYSSRRGSARFRGAYGPIGEVMHSEPGSLEHFLTERYCLYAVRGTQVSRANIHHLPWPLQTAEARIEENTMAESSGIKLPSTSPVLHFAQRMDVLVWWPEAVQLNAR
jgi:uncharacterized protein